VTLNFHVADHRLDGGASAHLFSSTIFPVADLVASPAAYLRFEDAPVSQLPPYNRAFSFSNFQAANSSAPRQATTVLRIRPNTMRFMCHAPEGQSPVFTRPAATENEKGRSDED
jgi:hypothetical protein